MFKRIFSLFAILLFSKLSYSQVSQADFEALVALYNATDGDNWTNNDNWDINATAADVTNDWHGVTVDGGRVTKIYLYDNNLVGSIPSEIGNLTALTTLYFYNNKLTSVPAEIGNLTSLEMLSFNSCDLTSFPAEIGNLPVLDYLSLNGNQITSIPSEIANLTALTSLDLGSNSFTSLPDEVWGLTALTNLDLRANQLTSLSSEIGGLTKLTSLDLGGNSFTNLPPEIWNLTALTLLNLDKTQLSSLPPEIGNLITLTSLSLSRNQLSSLPPEIGNLTKLTELFLYGNQLSSLPPEIRNLTALTRLYLKGNKLTSLPPEIGNLTTLTSLGLDNNQLISLPPEIGGLTALTRLYLKGNKLTSLPPEIGNLTTLTSLGLGNNQLTSLPPEIGGLTALILFRLEGNQLTSLPPEIGNLTKLTELFLYGNQLISIPAEIKNLTGLGRLYLYSNQLTSLPNMGGISSLNDMRVENNFLDYGDLEATNLGWTNITNKIYSPQALIPIQYKLTNNQATISVAVQGTNNVYQWYQDDVAIINATNNFLLVTDNTFQNYHCEVTNPDFPDLTLISESIYLPSAVSETEYDALVALYNATGGDNWTNNTNWLSNQPVSEWYGVEVYNNHVSTINIEDNDLNGHIPNQIGELTHLTMLGLNTGNLSGVIPSSIGNLTQLTYLGLSGNQLTGNVPAEITQLENLQNIALFDNQLTGMPDMSALTTLETLSLSTNNFTFEDLEPNIGVASMGFDYSPQATVGMKEEHRVAIGKNDTLIVSVGGDNNVYEWYKDGNALPNSNNDTLIISGFAPSDAGKYYCKITNTVATDLTLQSDTFTLLQAFNVTFSVTDKNGNIENATITLADYGNQQTNASGTTTFEKVTAKEGLAYTVNATGYDEVTGTTSVVDQDVNIDVALVTTGINDIEENLVKIFPNPSDGEFTINLDKVPGKNSQLIILDLNGKNIYQHKLTNTETKINLEGRKGTFILKIVDDADVYGTYKLFVK